MLMEADIIPIAEPHQLFKDMETMGVRVSTTVS